MPWKLKQSVTIEGEQEWSTTASTATRHSAGSARDQARPQVRELSRRPLPSARLAAASAAVLATPSPASTTRASGGDTLSMWSEPSGDGHHLPLPWQSLPTRLANAYFLAHGRPQRGDFGQADIRYDHLNARSISAFSISLPYRDKRWRGSERSIYRTSPAWCPIRVRRTLRSCSIYLCPVQNTHGCFIRRKLPTDEGSLRAWSSMRLGLWSSL